MDKFGIFIISYVLGVALVLFSVFIGHSIKESRCLESGASVEYCEENSG